MDFRKRLVIGVLLPLILAGCTTTSTNDYNLCALGAGAAGLGVGLASGGTGAVVLATGAGAGIGYMICQEEVPAPASEPVVDAAAPAMVETDGDGDGVPDHRDDCPNTEPGVRVDERGCALPIILDSAMLNFAFDSAVLPNDAADSLKAFVDYIKRYPTATFEVAGHADSTGAESYNQGLSERRASAVARYLESRGVPPGRLRVVGYGEMEPIASNETESGRARNRRVEVRVIDEDVAFSPDAPDLPWPLDPNTPRLGSNVVTRPFNGMRFYASAAVPASAGLPVMFADPVSVGVTRGPGWLTPGRAGNGLTGQRTRPA